MPRNRMLLLGAAFVLVAVAAYFVGAQRQSREFSQRLAAMEGRQRALESGYLNGVPRAQLASQLGYASAVRGAAAGPADEHDRVPMSPEQARNELQDRLAKLDQAFMTEPLDAKWAGETRNSVEDSMVNAAAESGVQPRSFSADCRSKSCMISMDVASGTEMDQIIDVFTTEISGKLPITTMIPVTGPDGRVTMHILGTQDSTQPAPRG